MSAYPLEDPSFTADELNIINTFKNDQQYPKTVNEAAQRLQNQERASKLT